MNRKRGILHPKRKVVRRMIGYIFPPNKLKRIAAGFEKTENIAYYYELAEKNKVDLLFYSLRQIDISQGNVKGLLYFHQEKKLEEHTVSIPKVNLVRTILRNKSFYEQLKELEKKEQRIFINLIPERNKYVINQFLSSKQDIRSFIPSSELLSFDNLKRFLKEKNKIIIKPINGALGNRIMAIEKNQGKFIVRYMVKKKLIRKEIPQKELDKFFQDRFKNPNTYLLQPWIDFKTFENAKFDIRTSVQKDKKGKWQVTGIVTRVAKKDGIVTNVAQGGRAVSFAELKNTLAVDPLKQINQLSLKIALALEELYPATADLGLDIGIDEKNHLWFIEANYADQRYAYRESNDLDMWYNTYKTPFEYALFTKRLDRHQR